VRLVRMSVSLSATITGVRSRFDPLRRGPRFAPRDPAGGGQEVDHDVVRHPHDGVSLEVLGADLRSRIVREHGKRLLQPGDVLGDGIDEKVDVLGRTVATVEDDREAADQDVAGPGFFEGPTDPADVVDRRRPDLRDVSLLIHSCASSKLAKRKRPRGASPAAPRSAQAVRNRASATSGVLVASRRRPTVFDGRRSISRSSFKGSASSLDTNTTPTGSRPVKRRLRSSGQQVTHPEGEARRRCRLEAIGGAEDDQAPVLRSRDVRVPAHEGWKRRVEPLRQRGSLPSSALRLRRCASRWSGNRKTREKRSRASGSRPRARSMRPWA
jgi:hypothetical protein